jgi:anti-sigma regulatory factor (Ser/Thr protein kinase)
MDNAAFSTYKIDDRSYISFVKREIHNLLTQAGFTTRRTGEIDIIVSELTSNLIKHADTGELVYRLSSEEGNKAFEIFCIDNGPGSSDITKMMKDGASTSNTLGHGLGAIGRLSDVFQIYSLNGWGTVAYSKSFMLPVKPSVLKRKTGIDIKALIVCYPGEKLCGDGYFVKKAENQTGIFLGDGLGHGPHANDAVQQAIEAFKTCEEADDPVEILRFINEKVKKTRGLVGTVAIFGHKTKVVRICGVGNITTTLCHGLETKNCMSYNGIIGLRIPNSMNYTEVDVEKYQCIIMYSDGIKSRLDLSKYPALLKYDPSIIASAIFKDNARRNDDTTVLVGKLNF